MDKYTGIMEYLLLRQRFGWWAYLILAVLFLLIFAWYLQRQLRRETPVRSRHRHPESRHQKNARERLEKSSSRNRKIIKIGGGIILCLLTVVFAAGFIWESYRISLTYRDLSESSFAEYTGAFTVEYGFKNGRKNSDINQGIVKFSEDGETVKAIIKYMQNGIYKEYPDLTPGEYYGTVVYGAHSRLAVYWDTGE